LVEEVKKLTEKIEELVKEETQNKNLRDQELADLRKERDNLRQQKAELEDKHKKFIEDIKNRMEGEGNTKVPVNSTEEERTFIKLGWIIEQLKN